MGRAAAAARAWLAMAAVWSGAVFAVLAAQHQVLRLQANDPQVQLAEDAARRLAGGALPAAVLPGGEAVAIERSLAPWLLLYDEAGAPLAGSGRLHDALPKLPGAVLPEAKRRGGHRLSWQPEPGVRQALVIVPVRGGPGGYAVAGRSLRETEERKRQVLHYLALIWAAGLAGLLLPAALLPRRAA